MIRKLKQWFCKQHDWKEAYPTYMGRVMECDKCGKLHNVVDNWR